MPINICCVPYNTNLQHELLQDRGVVDSGDIGLQLVVLIVVQLKPQHDGVARVRVVPQPASDAVAV